MSQIEMGKEYRTRDGRSVRLLCTDGPSNCPVVAITGGVVMGYSLDGKIPGASHLDLVEVRKKFKREVWANVYPEGMYDGAAYTYISKDLADRMALANERIACIKVIIEGEEGEGL